MTSNVCPDLTHSAGRSTQGESVNEYEDKADEYEDKADEYEDNADEYEWVQPIAASTDEQGELVIGHRVGCIAKIIDDGEDKSTSIVIAGKALLCPGIWDAEGKRRIVGCHQEDCVFNECSAAARTETTPVVKEKEELPIQCFDKCNRGELVLPPRYQLA